MKAFTKGAIALGAAAALVAGASVAANAYPAGTTFKVVTTTSYAKASTYFGAKAIGAYPGCSVDFSFDNVRDTNDSMDDYYMNGSGAASVYGSTGTPVPMRAPITAGAYKVNGIYDTDRCPDWLDGRYATAADLYVGRALSLPTFNLAVAKKTVTVTGTLSSVVKGLSLTITLQKQSGSDWISSGIVSQKVVTDAKGGFKATFANAAAATYRATATLAANKDYYFSGVTLNSNNSMSVSSIKTARVVFKR